MKQIKNLFSKLYNNIKIIFSKKIDVTTQDGRIKQRQKAIALTSFFGTISKVIRVLIPFITIKVSRAYLGEEIYGLWSAVNSFFAVFTFADLGLGNGLQTNLSKANGKDNNELECKELISSTFMMLIFMMLALLFFFVGIYSFVNWAELVGAKEQTAIELAGPVFLAIVIPKIIDIPIVLTQRVQIALQEGYNYYIWNIVGGLLSLLSVYLCVYFGTSKLILILFSSLINTLIPLLNFIYYFCFTKRRKLFPSIKYFKWQTCKKMLMTGFSFLTISILMSFGLSTMDSFIAGKIDSLSMAGDYSICLKVSSIINIIAQMLSLPLWGVYGEALTRGDVKYVKKHVVKTALFVLGLSLFATLCGMILSPIAFKIIVGESFDYNPLTLLGMFMLQSLFGFTNPFFMILNGTGKIRNQIFAYALFTPLSFVLKWVLCPIFGVHIMPWITFFCYLLIMTPIIIYTAFAIIKKYENSHH